MINTGKTQQNCSWDEVYQFLQHRSNKILDFNRHLQVLVVKFNLNFNYYLTQQNNIRIHQLRTTHRCIWRWSWVAEICTNSINMRVYWIRLTSQTPTQSFLRSNQSFIYLTISHYFMDQKASILCSETAHHLNINRQWWWNIIIN